MGIKKIMWLVYLIIFIAGTVLFLITGKICYGLYGLLIDLVLYALFSVYILRVGNRYDLEKHKILKEFSGTDVRIEVTEYIDGVYSIYLYCNGEKIAKIFRTNKLTMKVPSGSDIRISREEKFSQDMKSFTLDPEKVNYIYEGETVGDFYVRAVDDFSERDVCEVLDAYNVRRRSYAGFDKELIGFAIGFAALQVILLSIYGWT